MGNSSSATQSETSAKSVLSSIAQCVAFVGSCVERKSQEISEYVDKESKRSVVVAEAIAKRRAASASQQLVTPRTSRGGRSPPLSARSRQNIADREDHIMLSARSIAIQKKAPLFRDGDDVLSTPQAPLSARKLDMNAINDMIEKDKQRRSAAPTPRVSMGGNHRPDIWNAS